MRLSLSQIHAFFFFREIYQIDKFEGTDFKYHNKFLKFQPKNTQDGIFGTKSKHFCFFFCFAEFGNQTNSRVLISNMTISFSKSSPKIPESGILGTKFKHFRFFVKFYKDKNLRVLISNMIIVRFSNSCQKIPKQGIFNPKIRHFWFFEKIWLLDKLEGADFKYDNIFLKLQPKNTQIRDFLYQTQAFLFFREILQIDKFEGVDFKYGNRFFLKFLPKNIQRRYIQSQVQALLFFLKSFAIRQIGGC